MLHYEPSEILIYVSSFEFTASERWRQVRNSNFQSILVIHYTSNRKKDVSQNIQ